jgi:hypothetical protein
LSRVLFSSFLALFIFNEKSAKKKKTRAVGFEPVTGRLLINVLVHSTISTLFEHKFDSDHDAFFFFLVLGGRVLYRQEYTSYHDSAPCVRQTRFGDEPRAGMSTDAPLRAATRY